MALLGAAALLLFGPEQLPRVARKAGNVMREIQNTSQSFIREMERAADLQDAAAAKPYEPPPYEPVPYDAAAYDSTAYDDPIKPYEDPLESHAGAAAETAHAGAGHAMEPPAPDPEPPAGVGHKLAEPRPALDLIAAESAEPADEAPPASHAAQPAPQGDHTAHL